MITRKMIDDDYNDDDADQNDDDSDNGDDL